jgi:FkbM family methyltransferase
MDTGFRKSHAQLRKTLSPGTQRVKKPQGRAADFTPMKEAVIVRIDGRPHWDNNQDRCMRRWLKHWRDQLTSRRARTVEVQSIFGPMTAFAGDFATRQIEQFGAHTRNEVALLRSFVKAGDLIYDVGAHIGTFTIPLAQATGETGRVIAIEAEERSFALLRQNLDRHGLVGRVTPLLGLAGGRDDRYRPTRLPDHTSATYFTPDEAGNAMQTIHLDDLHATGSARAAVMKIDVEGMELSVLQSAEQTIARDRPVLYVEIANEQLARYATTPDDIETFLRRFDYRFFRNVGDRNSTHDRFEISELAALRDGGAFYDVLAVSGSDQKLARALQR